MSGTVEQQLEVATLFGRGEESFLRAAEIADLDLGSFRLLLHDRGIPWEVEAESAREMDRAIERFFRSSR